MFFLIKVTRLWQAIEFFSFYKFIQVLKSILKYCIGKNILAINQFKIYQVIHGFFKILRVAIFVGVLSYLVGIGWYIFCELNKETDTSGSDFNTKFDLNSQSDKHKAIVIFYWALTTISRVGLGDFYPTNNGERLLCCLILLLSVMAFSYIISFWISIIHYLSQLSGNLENRENLNKFMFLLARFDNQ